MNSNEMGFCGSSQTGESIRFRTRHIEVRILPPQPPIPLGRAPEETPEWAGNPGFSRIRFRLWTPALPDMRRKSPKVSVHFGEYSRFGDFRRRRVRSGLPPDRGSPFRTNTSNKSFRVNVGWVRFSSPDPTFGQERSTVSLLKPLCPFTRRARKSSLNATWQKYEQAAQPRAMAG
jgi:hypothetical protein